MLTKKTHSNEFGKSHHNMLTHIGKVAFYGLKQHSWKHHDPKLVETHNAQLKGVRALHKHQDLPLAQNPKAVATVFGHASAMVRVHRRSFLLDPVWSPSAGPFGIFGPKRKTDIMSFDLLQKPDYVLISHDHYDHLDLPTLKKLEAKFKPTFICGLGVKAIISRQLPQANVIELGWWESYQGAHEKISFVPAQHFSGRSWRMNETLWGGFVVETQQHCFYYAGDTGLELKILDKIKGQFPKIDLGLIPIGAFEPYHELHHYHLSPSDALLMQRFLDIPQAIAVHFGSFHLSWENAAQQVESFLIAHKNHSVQQHEFALPEFGIDYAIS